MSASPGCAAGFFIGCAASPLGWVEGAHWKRFLDMQAQTVRLFAQVAVVAAEEVR